MPTAVVDRLSEIKAVLRALLISNGKTDVTIPRLNSMYREEEDENIPFREFGYPSLQEFLRSIPDVVILRYNREHQLCAYHVDTEKSAHISSLVSRQKKPQKKAKFNASYKPRNSYGNYYYNYSRPPSQLNAMSTLNSLHMVLQELRKAPKYLQNHNGIRKSDILQKFNERPGKSSIHSLQSLNARLKELSQYLVVDDDFVYFKEDVVTSSVNTALAKSAYQNLEVRCAPSHNPKPLLTTNQQVNGYRPESHRASHFSQPSTQMSQSQISCTTQNNQNKKTTLTGFKQTHQGLEINSGNIAINERIKFRLQKLIEKYPEGIWAAELPSIYRQEYNIDLDYHDSGFNSITEFVSAVPEILTITDPDDTGRHMILDAKIPLNKTQNKHQTKSLASHYNFDDYITNDREPVPNKLSSTVCQKFIPDGMMGFDETVEHISVGSLSVEDYFEVNISEIFTPSFFWITLRKNKSKIKKLMDELDGFYKHEDLDLCRLPQALIETGLNVACIYAKMWHRAIIKKVKPDGYVVVLFYDYGTVKTYNPNHLYYLHKKFSALPAQALACGLYNVKAPHGNEWPILSVNMFVNKVWGVPLVATVCETNENNNTMMITLTDTNDESFDLHLNEWMIDSGLAVRGKMENIPSNKYHVVTYGVPIDKLYMYDEDILRKRDQDYEKSLKKAEQDGTRTADDYTEAQQQADIKDTDSASNYVADTSFDASSIASLVRENIDLTKQTNTITQAILSSMPISKLDMPTFVKSNGFENKTNTVSSSCSEDIKKISSDSNGNLSAIKTKYADIINDSCTDVFKSGSVYSNQINDNSNRESSAVSLSSLPSSMQSAKRYSNELSDHRQSNQSLYSRQSTPDIPLFNNESHEYNKLCFTDGTPTLYSIAPKKNLISVKYPFIFANTLADNNTTINGNVMHAGSCMKESDEGYQTGKFASSAQTSDSSSSTSFNAKSSFAPFVPIELTARCFRKIIHVFHLENEGWISVNEFVDCFTNLKLDKIMFKILDIFNINITYNHLTRARNPQLFSQLDQSRIKAPREPNGKIKHNFVLTLLPIKAMLHVLAKLDFVDRKIFKEAAVLMKQHKENAEAILFEKFNNRILYDALNVLVQYREFRRSHVPQ